MGFVTKCLSNARTHAAPPQGEVRRSVQVTDASTAIMDVPALIPFYIPHVDITLPEGDGPTVYDIADAMIQDVITSGIVDGAKFPSLVAACDTQPKPAMKLRYGKSKLLETPQGMDPIFLPEDVPVIPCDGGARVADAGRPVLQQPGPHDDLYDWLFPEALDWPDDTTASAGSLWGLCVRVPIIRRLLTRGIMSAIYSIMMDPENPRYGFFTQVLVSIPAAPYRPAPACKEENPPKKAKRPHTCDQGRAMSNIRCLNDMYEDPQGHIVHTFTAGWYHLSPARALAGRRGNVPVYMGHTAILSGEADISGPRMAYACHLLRGGTRLENTTLLTLTCDSDAIVTNIIQRSVYGKVWPCNRFVMSRKKGGIWCTTHITATPEDAHHACNWALLMAMLGCDFMAKNRCRYLHRWGDKKLIANADVCISGDRGRCAISVDTDKGVMVFDADKGMDLLMMASKRTAMAKKGVFTVTPADYVQHAYDIVRYYGLLPVGLSLSEGTAPGGSTTQPRWQLRALLRSRLSLAHSIPGEGCPTSCAHPTQTAPQP